jgi:hypothetical protein
MAAGQWRNELFGDWFPLAAKFFKTKGKGNLLQRSHFVPICFVIIIGCVFLQPKREDAKRRGGFPYCPKSTRGYEPRAYCLSRTQQRDWKG